MKLCIIFNPTAGRRRAKRRLSRFLEKYESRAKFLPTQHAGHAVELARQAAEEGYTMIAAAGGDGTAHDVTNGLLQSGRDATLAVVPIGSANDYSHSVVKQFGTSELLDGPAHAVDVGRLRAGDRERYFIACAGMGLAARVTMESQSISWLQGVALYGLAAWRALRKMSEPPEIELAQDGDAEETRRRMTLSVMLGRREGGFLLAPHASLDDGLFDLVDVGRLGRWEALRLLPKLARSGPPDAHPEIRLGHCRSLLVRSSEPLPIHTDGELVAIPEDGIREISIELLPRRLKVKVSLPDAATVGPPLPGERGQG